MSLLKKHSGSITLELGFSVIAFIIILTLLIDTVTLFRSRSAIQEAAFRMASEITHLESVTDTTLTGVSPQSAIAVANAKAELTAILPNANFNCGNIHNPNCIHIDPDVAQSPVITPPSIRVKIEYDVPTILAGSWTLSALETRAYESSKIPTSLSVIQHGFLTP